MKSQALGGLKHRLFITLSYSVLHHHDIVSMKWKDSSNCRHEARTSPGANVWSAHAELGLFDSQENCPWYFGLHSALWIRVGVFLALVNQSCLTVRVNKIQSMSIPAVTACGTMWPLSAVRWFQKLCCWGEALPNTNVLITPSSWKVIWERKCGAKNIVFSFR